MVNREMEETIFLLREDLHRFERYADSDRKRYEVSENAWRTHNEQLSL